MKGIQSKHLRKKLRGRRLKLSSTGRYNDCDLTIRLTNITPKWKYGLRYCDGNIYRMDSWETIKVNIVVSGNMNINTYTSCDGVQTETKSQESIVDWNERNSKWCIRSTRRQVRDWISDGDYGGRYRNETSMSWGGGIGITKLLQLFGIPSQDVKIGTIKFE